MAAPEQSQNTRLEAPSFKKLRKWWVPTTLATN